MALRDLVEGECGRASSVVKLSSHFVQDQGLKEEGVRHPFSHDDSFTNQSEQLIQQFLEETLSHSPTFRMDSLLAEMRDLESSSTGCTGPIQSAPVSQLAFQEDSNSWAEQYLESGSQFQDIDRDSIWASDPRQPHADKNQVFELGFGPTWAQEYLENQHASDESNTEVFLPNISSSEEYVENDSKESDLKTTANEIVSTMDDPTFAYSKFLKFMRQMGDGGVSIHDGEVISCGINDQLKDSKEVANIWAQEFDRNAAVINTQSSEKITAWEKEFSANSVSGDSPLKINNDENFSQQLWKTLSEQWEKMLNVQESESWNPEATTFNSFKEYTFAPENPLVNDKDALEEGKKKLAAGDLPSAVLCFEAAAQQQPENAHVWELLGTTQAENEQDPHAISALRKCIQLDSKNLSAWMALAVSYVNENFQTQACYALKEWLRMNPKYSNLVPLGSSNLERTSVSSLMSKELHAEIKNLFMRAARQNPADNIDPDIQCGLGVLFNLSNEYDKAVDCLKSALQARPKDAKLWNRLGATLANADRSEEAVDAYHNALQLSPGFIRARYNLGITCVHLKAYKEAAEHLLQALNFQAAGRGVVGNSSSASTSDSIWATLRLVLSLLERVDLIPALEKSDLKKLNSEFGIE